MSSISIIYGLLSRWSHYPTRYGMQHATVKLLLTFENFENVFCAFIPSPLNAYIQKR